MAQTVKNSPAMSETLVRSLVWEDPLEKGMATHSSILAWRIPQRSLAGSSTLGRKESGMTERFFTFSSAAAAKSLQSCPTLCDPIDGSPPGSTFPGLLQARTLGWVAISFSIA